MQRVESRGPGSSREEECEGLSVEGTFEGGQTGRISELGSEPPPGAWWARVRLLAGVRVGTCTVSSLTGLSWKWLLRSSTGGTVSAIGSVFPRVSSLALC